MSFGSWLRKYRKESSVPQKKLARIVGIDPSYLSKIEHDQRLPPDRSAVIKMADSLDLQEEQTDRLLTAAGYQPQTLFDLGFEQDDFSFKKHLNVLREIREKAPLAAYLRAKEEIADYLDLIRLKYTQKIDPEYFKKNLLANYLYSQVRRLGLKELYRLVNRPLGGALVLDNQGRLLLHRIGIGPIKGWWHIPIGYVNSKKGDKEAKDIAVRLVKKWVSPKERERLGCEVKKELTAPGGIFENLDPTGYTLRLGIFPSIVEIFEITLEKPELIKNSDQVGWFKVEELDQLEGEVHPLLSQIVEVYFKNKRIARILKKRGEVAIEKVVKKRNYYQEMEKFDRERRRLIK